MNDQYSPLYRKQSIDFNVSLNVNLNVKKGLQVVFCECIYCTHKFVLIGLYYSYDSLESVFHG